VTGVDAAASAVPPPDGRHGGRPLRTVGEIRAGGEIADPFGAADYDREFTDTVLGRLLRGAVHRRLETRFAAGARVLEIGCGTGEDAVHLARRGVSVLATDVSPVMVAVARKKVAAYGMENLVTVERIAAETLGAADLPAPFAGAFSNFGGLNCVPDLAAVARDLGGLLAPGAPLVLCVMGPLVPWEWLHFLAQGKPGKAFRRLARQGASWRGIHVHYPSIRRLWRDFSPYFRLERVAAVGALLPPSYLEAWAGRHPRLVGALAACERRLERCAPLPWLADHYLAELVRR
jgi:SAM-dependent methyltransferase